MAVDARQSVLVYPSPVGCATALDGRGCRGLARRGYTLMDVLVSMVVIAVLLSLMAPVLSSVRETTRRVVCSSNQRQLGMTLAMYAEDYRGALPVAGQFNFSTQVNLRSQDMPTPGVASYMTLRAGSVPDAWDGLGVLFYKEYANTPGVFYCPSHRGENPYSKFADVFPLRIGEIQGNYQYRGEGPNGARTLDRFPDRAALVSDGMRTQADYSHLVGSNALSGDLSVAWFHDGGLVMSLLVESAVDGRADDRVKQAWRVIDEGLSHGGPKDGGPK